MAALQGAIFPSTLTVVWYSVAPATLVGVALFLIWETAAPLTTPAAVDRAIRWLVLIPVAAFLLLGVSAALDAAQQAVWHADCLATSVPFCQPAAPTLYLGSALWIGEGAVLLLGPGLAASERARAVLASRSLVVALALILAGNLILGTVVGFFTLQVGFYVPVNWVWLRTFQFVYISAGLLWSGLLTFCGFSAGAWPVAARLLGWMNLVPTAFLALAVGMFFLGGGWPSGL